MKPLVRCLQMKLPPRQSGFLWGARQTGKSTYLRQRFPDSVVYDLLRTDLYLSLNKQPSLLREQLLALPPAQLRRPIIIDEIQKAPALLDEVHWLIEHRRLQFVLCGSSARQLKRGHANLLGGRAWRYHLHPLVSAEVPSVDLLRALNQGMLPVPYQQTAEQARRSLTAYVQDYLKEEVFAEGLTRNVPAFARFFDAMGYSHGGLLNYANIARDCGVDAKTVREYYQILVDTLLGAIVEPFRRRQDRQVITRAGKFYLFDVGVAGAIIRRRLEIARGEHFGHAFEHFIFNEVNAYRSYSRKDFAINFWRTKSGQEVDFVLDGGAVAIEVKGAARLNPGDLRSLAAFTTEYRPRHSFVVCQEPEERVVNGIRVLPWRCFLHQLWEGKII